MNLTPCTEVSISGGDEGRLFAFSKAPRCGAMAKRRASPCLSPAVRGKARCRMHGGARGSGAPKGSQNALKHGYHTQESISQRYMLRKLLKEGYEFVRQYE
jgi:glucans biosynthesis protein